MSAVGGDWRNGPAYDFLDQVGVDKIAHEFLRRNNEYASDYATVNPDTPDEQPPPALARWGLRFRGPPACSRRPGDHRLASPS